VLYWERYVGLPTPGRWVVRPALVLGVADDHPETDLDLTVFHGDGTSARGGVPYSTYPLADSWSWPAGRQGAGRV